VTFTAKPTIGAAPLSVAFAGTFTDGDSWTLGFGDGQAKNSTTGEVAATHDYVEAGSYVATLTVRNTTASDSKTVTITVDAASPSPSPS
jgi:PKD repeat protein